VIALAGAIVGARANSAWMWFIEAAASIGLACLSWQYVETPILREGFLATCARWRVLVDEGLRPVGARRKVAPMVVAASALIAVAVAGYGVTRPPGSATPSGLLRQVAEGQQISASTQATARPSPGSTASLAPAAAGRSASPSASPSTLPASAGPALACRSGAAHQPPKVSGGQVTAIGDSVMVASAAALNTAMPGIYIDAQVGRAMIAGLAIVQALAADGELRHYVVVGLGTNGPVSDAQIRQLRRLIGPDRDLILINTFGPMPWEASVNKVLDGAAEHMTRVSLADWHAAIAARTDLLWPDGIHPQPSGAKVYARVVLAAIQALLVHASPPQCGRPVNGPR
jgi:hypothetical protein